MAEICGTCQSLVIRGQCTNERCGTGNRIKWSRGDPAFRKALESGQQLITAPHLRGADLGGPPLGLIGRKSGGGNFGSS
jgi:hypothetical protein